MLRRLVRKFAESQEKTVQCGDGMKRQRGIRRPDLRSMQAMRRSGQWINQDNIFGFVPGLAINQSFEYKAEMQVLGLHKGHTRGISYITSRDAAPGPTLAFSVSMAGLYEGDGWDLHEVWYTGEGGNFMLQSKRERVDQSLTKGNAALYNNMQLRIPVRVFKSIGNKRIVFDGLWDVKEMKWTRTDSFKVKYSFRLKRRDFQPPPIPALALDCVKRRKPVVDFNLGLIVEDLSGNMEKMPVPVVNLIDDELPPGAFKEDVAAGVHGGDYWKLSEEEFVYMPNFVFSGILICRFPEPPKGVDFRLQVFRKAAVGHDIPTWGVRTLENIPQGAYVLTYVGEILSMQDDVDEPDPYLLTLTVPEKISEFATWEQEDHGMEVSAVDEYIGVSTYRFGNVARFIKHSSTPNLRARHVGTDERLPHICMRAKVGISVGEELSFDPESCEVGRFEEVSEEVSSEDEHCKALRSILSSETVMVPDPHFPDDMGIPL